MSETPIEVGDIEWIDFRYRDLEDDELFWFKKIHASSNKVFRKIDNNTALDISDQNTFDIDPRTLVYQKEY